MRFACYFAQIIPSVEGKRVLHISAGGKHTMAVVEHDHRPGRMRHGPTTPTGAYGQMGAQSLGAHSVHPRVPSMHPVMASTNNFATVLRESASNITTPFSQPVAAVAAAGLQSLQNMVSNSVAPKVKPPVPTSRAGRQVRVPRRRLPLMSCRRQCYSTSVKSLRDVVRKAAFGKGRGHSGTDVRVNTCVCVVHAWLADALRRAVVPQAAGRHGGRMVMFPDPQPYINPRIDPHRTSARRSARHHHLGVGAASGALTKSVSMSAHLGKVSWCSILDDRCLLVVFPASVPWGQPVASSAALTNLCATMVAVPGRRSQRQQQWSVKPPIEPAADAWRPRQQVSNTEALLPSCRTPASAVGSESRGLPPVARHQGSV